MDNHEEILDALTAFGKNPNHQEIPSILEQYLNCVAKNGETLFPWSQLKPLILRKMELVIMELRRSLATENIPNRPNVENVRFDVIHARIIDSLHKFNGAPFTIQRLCELLIDPKRHYKRSDKFMRGLEKNVLVVSTVDPFGRKVVCESGNKPMLNGILDINGSYPPRDTTLSVPLPPVPGWVTTTTTPAALNRSAATVPTPDTKVDASSSVENVNKESDVVSNGVVGGLTVSSSVFSDQEDPIAVHSEEVVEETVVTMDTSEVSSVVTDGGEAMAEVERETADDREASFSSSSSSSSEDLSISSDSIENGLKVSPFGVTTNSFDSEANLDENRPWAAFSQDIKENESASSYPSNDQPVSNLPERNQISESASTTSHDASSSSLPLSSTLSPLAENQSPQPSDTTASKTKKNDGEVGQITSDQDSWLSSDSSSVANESFGFEPVNNSDNDTSLPTPEDPANSTSNEEKSTSSTTTAETTTTFSTVPDSQIPVTSSGGILTYAQVVASSTDKTVHLPSYDSTDTVTCDSVAGLERLVGSMEQSLSSSPSSSASIAHLPSPSSSSLPSSSHSDVTPSINSSDLNSSDPVVFIGSSQQAVPSSSDCSSEGEPVSKRLRLSLEEESMEEDGISTSSNSYGNVEDDTPTDKQQHKQATVDSSIDVEPLAQIHDESHTVTNAQMVAEDITQGENMECLDSSGSSYLRSDELGVNSSDCDVKSSSEIQTCSNEEGDQKDSVISNTESSGVSTTEPENKEPSQIVENE